MHGCFNAIFRTFLVLGVLGFFLLLYLVLRPIEGQDTALRRWFSSEPQQTRQIAVSDMQQIGLSAAEAGDPGRARNFDLSQDWEAYGLSFKVDPVWKIKECDTHEGKYYSWGIGSSYVLRVYLLSHGETQSYEHFAQVWNLSDEWVGKTLSSFIGSWEEDGVVYTHYRIDNSQGYADNILHGYCSNGMGFTIQLTVPTTGKAPHPDWFEEKFVSNIHFDAEAAFAAKEELDAAYVPVGASGSSSSGRNGSPSATAAPDPAASARDSGRTSSGEGDDSSFSSKDRLQKAVAAGDELLADGVSSYEELVAELEFQGFTQQEAIYAADELVPEWA